MNWFNFFQRSELAGTLKLYKREFLVAGLFSMVVNLLMLAPSLYMLQVFDRVMVSLNELTLVALSLITLFFFLVLAFSEWARSRLLVRLSVRIDDMFNTRVFGAAFEARLNRSDTNSVRAFNDLNIVRQFMTSEGLIAFFDAPWVFIYLLVLFVMHPLLGWIGLAGCLLLAAMAWLTERLTVKPVEQAQEAGSQAQLFLQGKLRNAEVIEAMGMLPALTRKWLTRHRNHLVINGEAQDQGHRIRSLTKFVRYSLQSITLGAGALLVIEGELTPGAMIAANILTSRALAPVELVIGVWRAFANARNSFRHLESLLQAHLPGRKTTARHVAQGELEIKQLTALAPRRDTPILHDINLTIGSGEVLGLVGPSGSGKSTLARAMLGIWPHTQGQVFLDGRPIQDWDRELIGSSLGYLPQDVQLFEGGIAENIARFGQVDSEKVIRAARLAGVHDMILHFPQGYDTPVGVGGSYLSAGQRQRIAMARALFGDPHLIVLDEPNSNLDEAGELALAHAIRELKGMGRTVVLITHRKGVLSITDRIVVLQQGRIAQDTAAQAFLGGMRPAAAA